MQRTDSFSMGSQPIWDKPYDTTNEKVKSSGWSGLINRKQVRIKTTETINADNPDTVQIIKIQTVSQNIFGRVASAILHRPIGEKVTFEKRANSSAYFDSEKKIKMFDADGNINPFVIVQMKDLEGQARNELKILKNKLKELKDDLLDEVSEKKYLDTNKAAKNFKLIGMGPFYKDLKKAGPQDVADLEKQYNEVVARAELWKKGDFKNLKLRAEPAAEDLDMESEDLDIEEEEETEIDDEELETDDSEEEGYRTAPHSPSASPRSSQQIDPSTHETQLEDSRKKKRRKTG